MWARGLGLSLAGGVCVCVCVFFFGGGGSLARWVRWVQWVVHGGGRLFGTLYVTVSHAQGTPPTLGAGAFFFGFVHFGVGRVGLLSPKKTKNKKRK